MRPVQPGDLVVAADDYYGLVLSRHGDTLTILLANGLRTEEPADSVRPVPLRLGLDPGDSPASFVEVLR